MSDSDSFGDALPALSIAQTAVLLSVSRRTINTYLSRKDDPLPARRGKGKKPTEIPLATLVDWIVRQRLAEVIETRPGDLLDPQQEKAQLDRARRHLAELDRRAREGDLLERGEVEAHVGRQVANARSRLLAIPARLGSVHGAEVAGAADALVREALEELASA